MTLGIWAFGFFVLTILLKGAIGILTGEVSLANSKTAETADLSANPNTAASA